MNNVSSMSSPSLGSGQDEMKNFRKTFEESYSPQTLVDLLRDRVAESADQVFGNWFEQGKTLTYRQLDDASSRLASSLLRLGVRKQTHVASMMSTCPEQPILWFALAKIGAVLVPVNSSYTGAELANIVNDSDAQFLVLSSEFMGVFKEARDKLRVVTDNELILNQEKQEGTKTLAEFIENGSPEFVSPDPVFPSDLINIQYTSGTTGFPKGCMLTHEFMTLFGTVAAGLRGAGGRVQTMLIWAPFYYIDGQSMTITAIALGATVFYPNRMSLTNFVGWLEKYEINLVTFPEPALKAYKMAGYNRDLKLVSVSAFNWGENLRKEFSENFEANARDGYGMTEIGLTTFVPVSAREKAKQTTVGVPAAFRDVKIVDAQGAKVARGEVGELWVHGRAKLLGYYKRPTANAESFEDGWFKTGDLFTEDEDGFYKIVGRKKDMIKRSGENISAREVEFVILDFEEIHQVAVLAVPDSKRKEEVKAYILLREGYVKEDVTPERILAHCKKRLAGFKLPRYIAFVNSFPYTPTGKIKKTEILGDGQDPFAGSFDCVEWQWK